MNQRERDLVLAARTLLADIEALGVCDMGALGLRAALQAYEETPEGQVHPSWKSLTLKEAAEVVDRFNQPPFFSNRIANHFFNLARRLGEATTVGAALDNPIFWNGHHTRNFGPRAVEEFRRLMAKPLPDVKENDR